MKKLTSAVVASSLVLGVASTAFAAPATEEVNAAYARLNHYNVVQGVKNADGTVTPALDQTLTRAQLITIVTRAFGQEENAKLLTGAKTGYSDVDGNAAVEWATGYIFIGQKIAAQKNITIGLPGGVFAPSKEVTQIETLAFVMKFLGIQVGSGANWVEDTIANAKAAGLLTDADVAKFIDNANEPATRGLAFALLDNVFSTYNKLEGGKTVYTAFVDTAAPELTVAEPTLTTDKAAITVTGSVKGEFSALYLGSEKIAANADGTFSVEVALNVGANTITVTAVDLAGNSDEASFTVTRNAGAAAKITASLPATVEAGSTADLTFEVTDANGVKLEVPASELTVTTAGNIGSVANGKFTAAEKVGTGTVTVAYGSLTPVTVDVKVVPGALAQVIADKTSVAKGEIVHLTAADKFGNAIASGVTYTWEGDGIAVANNGTVYTAASGKYTVTAKAGEATATTTIGVYAEEVAGLKVSAPETITANGKTRKAVTITAVDEFGNHVVSYDAKTVNLSGAGVTFFAESDDDDADAITQATLEDGTVTVYFEAAPAIAGEDVVVEAVDAADSEIKGEATLSAVAPVATSVKATPASKYLVANESNTQTIDVVVVDQDGEEVSDVYNVTATITGPAELDDDEATYGGVGSAATFTINNAKYVSVTGTITVTFNVEGVGSTTATINSVVAGNPEKIDLTVEKASLQAAEGATFEFTLQATDRAGVPVALYAGETLTVSLPKDIADAFEIDGQAPNADGEVDVTLPASGKLEFPVEIVDTFTGDAVLTVKGKLGSIDVTASKTISVTPGEVDDIALTRDGETVYAPVAAPKATYTISLVDVFGNAVAKSGVEVYAYAEQAGSTTNVTVNGKAASAAEPLKLTTDASGKATFEVVARPYGGEAYTVGAKYEGTDLTSTLAIENSVVDSLSTKLYKVVNGKATQATSVKAGETFYLVVAAKDNYGGPVDGIAGDLKLVAPADTLAEDTVTGALYDEAETNAIAFSTVEPAGLTLNDGEYVATLTAGKAGVISVGAKYTKLATEISKTSSISVKAGNLAKVVVNGGEDIEVTGTGKVHGAFTLALTDVFGNTAAQNVNKEVTVTSVTLNGSDAGSKLTFRTSENGVTVDKFSLKSVANFYLVATQTGTYTVTLTLDGTDFTFDVVVE